MRNLFILRIRKDFKKKNKQTLWWEDGIIMSFFFEAFPVGAGGGPLANQEIERVYFWIKDLLYVLRGPSNYYHQPVLTSLSRLVENFQASFFLILILLSFVWLDASASAPRSFVAWLVKIVSFFLFLSSLTNRWQSESIKKRKRWFKETTEWAEEGISVNQVQDGGTEGLPGSGSYRFTEHTGCPIPQRQLRCPC